jgi:hypothetical protein
MAWYEGCIDTDDLRMNFMKALLLALVPVLCSPVLFSPALADTVFLMSSTSEQVRYGLLVMSDEDCAQGRVTVQSGDAMWKSATLGPGEIAVVRMGNGFAVGAHALILNASGCIGVVHAARSVVLGKQSPDHGWRALKAR